MILQSKETVNRQCRTICLPFTQSCYDEIIDDPKKFRAYINNMLEEFPELFPVEIHNGYWMKDSSTRKKLPVAIRRIEINGVSYSIHPSFVMPYMTGMTEDVEKVLFLRNFKVPYWALAYIAGKNPVYWYRMGKVFGRFNLVGTTIRNPEDIPKDLAADEKHTRIKGQKAYIATTVADECILGVAVSPSSGEVDLKEAYDCIKEEARKMNPTYEPDAVNMDAWEPTKKVWKSLFPYISIIYCFLHVFIKIRDRGKKKYQEDFLEVATRLWDCYKATSKACFSQRVRRLCEWATSNSLPSAFLRPLEKLRKKIDYYKIAYNHPGCHRTSNMLDRLMQRMDIHLFNTKYFHGSINSAEDSIRAWALIRNFAPSNPNTLRKYNNQRILMTFSEHFSATETGHFFRF